MKKFFGSAAAVTLAVGLMATTAFAAGPGKPNPHANPNAPGQNKLLCFSGTTDNSGFGGTCTLKNNSGNGPATLSNASSNPNGDYSGVYYANSTLSGKTLASITELGYTYTGTTSPLPGDLSLNVPIDTNGDGTTDAYAFIDAFYCPGTNGVVDVIHDSSCGIYYNGTTFYPNWAAFVAAFPGAKVATDDVPFIVAERTPSEGHATWTVSNVMLGRPGK